VDVFPPRPDVTPSADIEAWRPGEFRPNRAITHNQQELTVQLA